MMKTASLVLLCLAVLCCDCRAFSVGRKDSSASNWSIVGDVGPERQEHGRGRRAVAAGGERDLNDNVVSFLIYFVVVVVVVVDS